MPQTERQGHPRRPRGLGYISRRPDPQIQHNRPVQQRDSVRDVRSTEQRLGRGRTLCLRSDVSTEKQGSGAILARLGFRQSQARLGALEIGHDNDSVELREGPERSDRNVAILIVAVVSG